MKKEKITKKQLLLIAKTNDKLLKKVISIIIANGDKGHLLDYIQYVLSSRCISGCISQLYYYSDTVKFYEKYKNEIQDLLNNTYLKPAEIFGDKWDKEDPLCLEANNQTLLAWFGFEETCLSILNLFDITF